MKGRIFAVVGPSGAGKDTLMVKVAQRLPDVLLVRRTITRPSSSGGEDFDGVMHDQFQRMLESGGFAIHWQAHGLRYGIPASVFDAIGQGHTVVFNGSRAALAVARDVFPRLGVIHVTAKPSVLRARLLERGRETKQEIEKRLLRGGIEIPDGFDVIDVDNSGDLEPAVQMMEAALTR